MLLPQLGGLRLYALRLRAHLLELLAAFLGGLLDIFQYVLAVETADDRCLEPFGLLVHAFILRRTRRAGPFPT